MGYDLHLDTDKYVYSHARAFSQNPNFSISYGVDPDKKKRQQLQSVYSVDSYGKISDLPDNLNIDILVVAADTSSHLNIIKEFFQKCVPKFVLCEKPLAYEVKEAEDVVKICKKNDVALFVNYMRKSLPETQSLRSLIINDAGSQVKGSCYYSKGLIHNGSHFLNLLEYWLGGVKDVKIIAAGDRLGRYDRDPDFFIEYEKGRVQFISAKEENYSLYNIQLILPSGFLHYNRGGEQILWYGRIKDPILTDYYSLSTEAEEISNSMDVYMEVVVKEIENYLKGKKYILCSGEEALQSLKLIVGKII